MTKIEQNNAENQVAKKTLANNHTLINTLLIVGSMPISLGLMFYRVGFESQWEQVHDGWYPQPYKTGAYIHFIFAPLWWALGPFQFMESLRQKHRKLHIWLGRFYVLCCTMSCIGAQFLSYVNYAEGAIGGFQILNFISFSTLVVAFYHIIRKDRDIIQHKKWMTRNYACAYSAFTFRIFVGIDMLFDHKVFYVLGAYFCVVPCLVVAELWMNYKEREQNKARIANLQQNQPRKEDIEISSKQSNNIENQVEKQQSL